MALRADRREFSSPPPTKLEIDPTSEIDREKIKQILTPIIGDDAADQFIFVLQDISSRHFVNRCNDATKEFGQLLAARYGDEESFFELAPNSAYSEMRSYGTLEKLGYRGDFHSLGLLQIQQKNKPPFSVTIDINYFTVSGQTKKGNAALMLVFNGGISEAQKNLAEQYGGKWNIEYSFDAEKKQFQAAA